MIRVKIINRLKLFCCPNFFGLYVTGVLNRVTRLRLIVTQGSIYCLSFGSLLIGALNASLLKAMTLKTLYTQRYLIP